MLVKSLVLVLGILVGSGSLACAEEVSIGADGEIVWPVAPPTFPPSFKANVTIISHLVDKTKDYPPWRRVIELTYDRPAGRALARVLEGTEAGRTYLRRYDIKDEFMIKTGRFPECQRSYLGEQMPIPELPADLQLSAEDSPADGGATTRTWVSDDGMMRTTVTEQLVDSVAVPTMLVTEQVNDGAVAKKLSTYQFANLVVLPSPLDDATFSLPAPYESRSDCSRHIGGFPYLHLFGHFLRV